MVSSIEKAIDPYKHHITIVTFDCSKSLRNESNEFMSFFQGKNVTLELLKIKKNFYTEIVIRKVNSLHRIFTSKWSFSFIKKCKYV